jgi:hypothetical protein
VRVEFLPNQEGASSVVAAATWNGSSAELEAEGEANRSLLERIFRPASVSVDDPALRSFGTNGEVILQPGSLRWFMAAAKSRGEAEGYRVRFVAEESGALGWDPAGAYRTFMASAERMGASGKIATSSTDSGRRPTV